MTEQRRNWAGNYVFTARQFHYPETLEQLQEIVRRAAKLRVIGSGHSFNAIADSSEEMVSLARLDAAPVIDAHRHTLTVGAGVKYGQICQLLHEAGYALPNLASLPHISVGGACATGTHGSGIHNGNLATAVSALEIVTADGSLLTLSREQDGDVFAGVVVGLGSLGVVTRLTLNLVPTFEVAQVVYQNLPLDRLLEHFEEIEAKAYSVSLFTDWRSDGIDQVWLKHWLESGQKLEIEPKLFGATAARTRLHPIGSQPSEACTEQRGIPGPWYERLPHFRMDFTPSSGEELQTEYLVPRHQAVAALGVIAGLRRQIAPLLQICEVRTIAADDLWMSGCYRQDRVGLHFTWQKDWAAVSQLLPLIEAQLAPFDAVPHWGKLFTMPAAQVQSHYARLPDFQRLLHSYDPQGKFRNAFVDKYIFSSDLPA